MEIEQVRKDMIRRFTDLEPELSPDVLSDEHYNNVYQTPFRARNIRALNKYEEKHSIQFCMDCRGKDDKTDKITAYRAYVTESDNLLENVANDWIRIQCFHCDFDLRFEKPKPKKKNVTAEQVRQIQEMMEQQKGMGSDQLQKMQQYAHQQAAELSGLTGMYGQGQAGMSAGEVEARQQQYNYELRRLIDNTQLSIKPQTIINPATSAPPPEKDLSAMMDEDIFRQLRKG